MGNAGASARRPRVRFTGGRRRAPPYQPVPAARSNRASHVAGAGSGAPQRIEGRHIFGDLVDAVEVEALAGDPLVESLIT